MKIQIAKIIFFLLVFAISACGSKKEGKSTTTPPPPNSEEQEHTPTPPPENKSLIFEGTYSYLADANLFVSCDKKKRMPVEMKHAYLDLERKYLGVVENGGEEVYVKLRGYTQEVRAMEGDDDINALIVTEVLEVDKHNKCK